MMRTLFLMGCISLFLGGCAGIAPLATGASGERLPYGEKVSGKPGFVRSPHTDSPTLIDVRDFPRGTEVSDPWSGKLFLVP